MAKLSKLWSAMLMDRFAASVDLAITRTPVPIMPWITHQLDPDLLALVLRLGERRKFRSGDLLFENNQKIDALMIVIRGVTARSMGNLDGQAIGLATPKRIAAGNLNFFSGRHAIGRYFAITDSELCVCSRSLLLSVLEAQPQLMKTCAVQFECCALSDRLSFACLSLLDARDRLKAFLTTWAVNFGELLKDESGLIWIRMPVPTTIQVESQIVNTSLNWVDRILHDWRESGLWRRERESVIVSPSLLEETYRWMRSLEEGDNLFRYPSSLTLLLEQLHGSDAPVAFAKSEAQRTDA